MSTRRIIAAAAMLAALAFPARAQSPSLHVSYVIDTLPNVQRAAQTYLDPDHLTVVVVGDIAKIRSGIETLGIGPVEVRDYNGNEVGR